MGKIKPNIVSGGTAIDLGNNLYYMRGKTHKQGGINIGSNPETGINVEKGEVVQTSPTGLRVFSAQPILNGISPANALLMGGNPNNIFNAQEAWKQANHYNDDGTKFEGGGYTPSQEIIDYIKKTEGFRDKWYKDGNGIDTIGYGFTGSRIKKLYPNGITREQADKEFADSIAKRAAILQRDTPNWNKLSQSQRDALLSYHYNVGEGSYRNKHKKLQQALADSDWENVVLNMDAGYNDKKNPGLRTRRDYERKLFRSGMIASLTGDEEKAFRDWYDRYSRSQNLDPNPDAKEHYYDYRTYWKNRTEQQKNDEWKLGNHLPDTYKKPGHPTFSTESIYSTRKTPGGTWKKVGLGPVYDEQFVDSKYTRRLKKYNNVSFRMGGIGPKNIIGTGGRKIVGKIVKDKYLTDYINKGQVLGYPTPLTFLNYVFSPYKNEYNKLNVDESSSYEMPRYGENLRRNLLAMYLGYDNSDKVWYKNNIVESKYKPSVSKNTDSKYYTFNGDIIEGFKYTAGQHKIDKGNDENGNYISFYDVWDLAPFSGKGDELGGIGGKPIELYDRIYEDNWRYKDALDLYNSQERLKQKYGGIHIKPSKRGTFTAAAKRHHMGVQEFARTVLNNRARYSAAMVKKANFARNASKWHKKELGGDMTKQYYITKDNIYSLGGNVRPKAELGTKYMIDENGRIIPINIPNANINIANLSDRNIILDPITVTDKKPKQYNLSGKVIDTSPITGLAGIKNNNHSFNNNVIVPKTNPNNIVIGPKEGLAGGLSYRPINTVKTNKTGFSISPSTADLIGLGVNLTGNLAASLINRSAIKGMRYAPAPIPISAQKLPTEVNIEPQVSSIRENVAGQERLIADNTADSRVALARRQRVRNQGAQQYQTLFGNKLNTELQLLTADRLNRQGVDAQNVNNYNQWRRGLYDFENRRREMLAENAVVGINNAAEAIAGERGYLARREARKQDARNRALIALTSPNAQKVFDANPGLYEELIRKMSKYGGNFNLLTKRLKK